MVFLVPFLIQCHVYLVLGPSLPYHTWVVRGVVTESLTSQLNMVITADVLPNADGVQPPSKDMGCAGVLPACTILVHWKVTISDTVNPWPAFLTVSSCFLLPAKEHSLCQKTITSSTLENLVHSQFVA